VAGALAGAIAGSFLATVALRWPAGRQATRGRSACDGCGRALRWFELVPLASWAAQAGRCRRCGVRIAPLHPATELAASAIGAGAMALAPDIGGAALALIGWQLLLLALLDARAFWLPHGLSLLLGLTGLLAGGQAMAALGLSASLPDRLIGGAAGFAGLWIVARGYRALRGRDGLGGGDPPFLAAVGCCTGWVALPFILLFAALAGLGVALAGGRGRGDALPFGTLVALATPFAIGTLRALA